MAKKVFCKVTVALIFDHQSKFHQGEIEIRMFEWTYSTDVRMDRKRNASGSCWSRDKKI